MISIVVEARENVRLAAPLAIMQVAHVGMGTATIALASRTGTATLAGVGLGLSVFGVVLVFANGVFSGAAVLVAEARMAGDADREDAVASAALVAALVLAVPTILLFATAELWLPHFGQPTAVASIASAFLRAAALGAPGAIAFAACRQIAAGVGRARAAAAVSIIAVVVLGGAGALALGVAPGTDAVSRAGVIGLVFSGTCTLSAAALAPSTIRLRRASRAFGGSTTSMPRPHAASWRRAIRALAAIGTPSAIMFVSESGFFAAATLVAGRLGATSLAAHSVVVQVSYVTFMVPSGIGMATAVRVASARVSGGFGAARRAGLVGIGLAAAFMTLPALALVLAPGLVTRATGGAAAEPRFASLLAQILVVAGVMQIPDGIQGVASAALRGLRRAELACVLASTPYWGVGVVSGAILSSRFDPPVVGLWWGIASALALAAAALSVAFLRETRGSDERP